MDVKYPTIGICGLSCQLCPSYQSESKSRCEGCKSEERIAVGCPFITCALKKKGIEFCWDCNESNECPKWKSHRAAGQEHDSFKCYQKLEDDIHCVQNRGIDQFIKAQDIREEILKEMLDEFNEGRSKSYYCIAATVMQIEELQEAVSNAKQNSIGLDLKGKSKVLHSLLNKIAESKNYHLRLRK